MVEGQEGETLAVCRTVDEQGRPDPAGAWEAKPGGLIHCQRLVDTIRRISGGVPDPDGRWIRLGKIETFPFVRFASLADMVQAGVPIPHEVVGAGNSPRLALDLDATWESRILIGGSYWRFSDLAATARKLYGYEFKGQK